MNHDEQTCDICLSKRKHLREMPARLVCPDCMYFLAEWAIDHGALYCVDSPVKKESPKRT